MFKRKKKKKRGPHPQRFPANWFVVSALLLAILLTVVWFIWPLVSTAMGYHVWLSSLSWSPDSADLMFTREAALIDGATWNFDEKFSRRETYRMNVTGEKLEKIESTRLQGYAFGRDYLIERDEVLSAASPDGVWVATIDSSGLTIDGPESISFSDYYTGFQLVDWSPDSAYLAFVVRTWQGRELNIISTETGIIQFQQKIEDISYWSWSPDSLKIAYIDPDHDAIWIVDITASSSRRVFKDPPGGLFNMPHLYCQIITFRIPFETWWWGCQSLPFVWIVAMLSIFFNLGETTANRREAAKNDQETPGTPPANRS